MRRASASKVGISVVFATVVGAFSPFCSCTVIPIVAGLLIGGVPLAPVMAIWVASPAMDPKIFKLPSPITDPTEDELELERRLFRTIRDMLEGLPSEQRAALELTEHEGMPQKDLADRLGISVSGAKSRVQRSRARLKALLLDCCHFELDRRGNVVNYYDRDLSP